MSHEPAAPHRPAAPAGGPAGAAGLVARLRAVHLEMLDAVLSGDGLQRVATLAADAAGAPVAIVVPRIGAAVDDAPVRPAATPAATELRRYVADRVADRPSRVPEAVAAEVPIALGRRARRRRAAARPGERRPRRPSSCTSRRWPR